MKKLRAKMLAAGMCGIISVGALAGCGSGTQDTNNNTQDQGTSQNSAGSTFSDDSAETTIKWALWDEAASPYYQPLIDGFEKEHPDIHVEMVDLGSSDYTTVLGTQLSGSGSDFDVVTIKDVPGYMTLVNKGVLSALDDRISRDGFDLSVYNGITDQLKVNDSLYELPFRSDIWALFYNKDVFDKAGVDYPTNDMTWEEYDQLARAVTDTTEGQEVYGTHYHTWRSTVQLMGVTDGKNSIISGDYEFMKPYYEMVLSEQTDGVCQDYATLKTQGLHYNDAFAKGNVAMINMGTWFLTTLIEKVGSGEFTECANWSMVRYPHAEGVEAGSTLASVTCLAVPTSAPHADDAWEFVKYVCGEEGAQIMAQTGTIPAITNEEITSTIASMEGFPQDENAKEALVTTHTYLEMPASEHCSEIDTVLNEQHDLIMTESESIEEGIATMNENVQAILAE